MPLPRTLLATLPLALLLTACPDPQTMAPGAKPPAVDGATGADQPGPPAPDHATFEGWDKTDGETVTLSGTLAYDGKQSGTLRIDFLGAGSLGGLQHTMTVDAAGPWSVKAPISLGSVYVVGFVDIDGDGPSPEDPAGRVADAVEIGAEDLADITLVLEDEPDLGDLTPGAGHPGPEGEADGDKTPPAEGEAVPPPPDGEGGQPPAEGEAVPPPPDGEGDPQGAAAPAGEAPAGEAAPAPDAEADAPAAEAPAAE